MREAYFAHRLFGEELFFLACCFEHPILFERAFGAYQDFTAPPVHASRDEIAELVHALRHWTNKCLAPSLSPDRLNVIGFSTTFAQVFASIFVCRELKRLAPAPMLFVLGGASVTMPETREALRLWEVEGLIVQSNGEQPLEALVRAIDTLPEGVDHMAAIGAAGVANVSSIGERDPRIEIGISRAAMNAIGDPDYDEFFVKLSAFCPDKKLRERLTGSVALPVEGSRGCFAKCDFCQNPLITSEFRSLDGTAVAERVQRLHARYRAGRVYFADSVCNSWAAAYSNRMIAEERVMPAFMELRVHAPEHFFTRLALAGVNEIQLGVEAVSETLLLNMRKGTKVWQNVRAVKYLAELGIRSVSNLITHHPRSTAEDVIETKRILAALTHLPRFSLSRFVISYGSPIWQQLSSEQREALTRGFVWLPEDLRPYSTQRDLAYPYPVSWLDPEARAAWDAFREDYLVKDIEGADEAPEELRLQAGSVVVDGRGAAPRHHFLDDDMNLLLALGHDAPPRGQARVASGLSERRFNIAMGALHELRLVLDVGERYLSLPLRSREALVANLDRVEACDRSSLLPVMIEQGVRA